MARIVPPPTAATLLVLLILSATTTSPPSLASSLSYSQYKTLISLSHSLITRVANLRASRGDLDGSARAHSIADKLDKLGLGFLWSVGWDYLRNYAWSRDFDYSEACGVVSDVNQLMGLAADKDDYRNALRVSKRLLRRLLMVFAKSGALKEIVETVQIEVVEGGLLRDCLEVGSKDFKSMLKILKDLALQFNSDPSNSGEL